jgi:SAM-dependent methyltransferase
MPTDRKSSILPASNWFDSDELFDGLYPASSTSLLKRHWTPLQVASKAAQFLAAEKNVSILDIGSGVGKFCIAAAHFMPEAFYTGIEQRQNLVEQANEAKKTLGSKNVDFIHGNFTKLNFKKFDHFYFFNSFYENFSFTENMDTEIEYSKELYEQYNYSLRMKLEQKPSGTRLATFHSTEDEIPEDFLVVGTEMDNTLKFWVKL